LSLLLFLLTSFTLIVGERGSKLLCFEASTYLLLSESDEITLIWIASICPKT